jgi:hypothetical protein
VQTDELRRRVRHAVGLKIFAPSIESHERRGAFDIWRSQRHDVEHLKDREIEADAEAENQNDGDGEPRRAPKRPARVSEVLPCFIEAPHDPCVARLFPNP